MNLISKFYCLHLLSVWETSICSYYVLHRLSMASENIASPKVIDSCTGHDIQSEPREPPKAFQGLLDIMGIFFLCSGGMVALGTPTRAWEKKLKPQLSEKQSHDTKRIQVFMRWHCLNSWLHPSMAKAVATLTSETPVSVETRLTRVFCQSKEPWMLWVYHYLRSIFWNLFINLSNFISIYSVPAAVWKFGFSLCGEENLDHFNHW